eukprot:m.58330 g.58330  ORF g.58330 m.58330 type:complete len:750 (-) comp11257_c1_seq2:146-2395(-)
MSEEKGPLISESFSFKLGYEVIAGCVAVGKLDGSHPHLVCAVPGGRVVVHNPFHARTEKRMDANLLHFNEEITAILCGNLNQSDVDYVYVGSAHHLVAYNVVENKNVFTLEMSDGCSSLATGTLSGAQKQLMFVGGTCSIYGYDVEGNDDFWTVTGDDVTAMIVSEFKSASNLELIVASENCELHSYTSDAETNEETTLSGAATHMQRVSCATVAYGLSTGTVGVLKEGVQLWEQKLKHHVSALRGFEVDGRVVVVVGWSNGLLEFRDVQSGKIVFSENLKVSIAGLVVSDYRNEGKDHLLVVLSSGKVIAFCSGAVTKHTLGAAPVVKENLGAKIRLLQQKRKDLLYRLGNLKKLQQKKKKTSSDMDKLIQTKMNKVLKVIDGQLHLLLSTNSGELIQSVTLVNDGIFEEDAHTVYFKESVKLAKILLPIPKLADFRVTLRCLIGDTISTKYLVTSDNLKVDKYACFCQEDVVEPSLLNAYAYSPALEDSILSFINSAFALCEDITSLTAPIGFFSADFGALFIAVHGDSLVIGADHGHTLNSFTNDLRDEVALTPVSLQKTVTVVKAAEENARESLKDPARSSPKSDNRSDMVNLNHATITHDDGDRRQNDSEEESGRLTNDDVSNSVELVLQSVRDLHAVRQKLVAEIADNSTLAKGLLLRAEDHRLMGNYDEMQQAYRDVMDVNQDILRSHAFRHSNQEKLMQQVRLLNKIIHSVAERKGGGTFIESCRRAIKDNDFNTLLTLLQ